ncbi:hypothetical protein F4821DRAFT_26994 [Hypoxylon rubiginosum]|uniref:Uncharacterized protein n=1 Tax=Hypoxylon rubiginosum TaxID=110542 RepID=A0ACC0CLW9_9PEZI|nr:hypothetical protein F4821DRAFT_26994 [Hypoxylon rubiginosum]
MIDTTGHAFVTGGGSGIGKACVLLFAELGIRGIVVADLNLETAQTTVAEATAAATNSDFRAEAIQMDVSLEESVKSGVEHMVKSFGRIDYCVHSAGITIQSSNPVATSFSEFQLLDRVNVHGTFLVTKAVAAAMALQEPKPVDTSSPERGIVRGSIVNMASIAAVITPPSMVQYISAKFAVNGITKSAAIENAPLGIRVNCLCPTWTETPLYRKTMDIIPQLNDETSTTGIPMQRIATTKEVAQSAVFMCSTWSSFITGHALAIDGGMSLF